MIKLCKDCKHYQKRCIAIDGRGGRYEIPSVCRAVVDLETGEGTKPNRIDGECGKEGKLWEKIPKKPIEKWCTTCKHYIPEDNGKGKWWSGLSAVPKYSECRACVDLVNGRPIPARLAREGGGGCGRLGNLWEPKDD